MQREVSQLIIWETWRGVLIIKEDNGKTWNGKAPGKTHHANRRGSRSLQTMVKTFRGRPALGKREERSRQCEAFKPGKTIQLSSHSQLFTFITP